MTKQQHCLVSMTTTPSSACGSGAPLTPSGGECGGGTKHGSQGPSVLPNVIIHREVAQHLEEKGGGGEGQGQSVWVEGGPECVWGGVGGRGYA